MGLMAARVGHTLSSSKVVVPIATVTAGVGATGLVMGAQWGWGADFDKHEKPGGGLLFAGTAASVIGGGISLAAWSDRSATISARGRVGFASALGVLGATWIGVPVARRALAEG